MFVILLLYLYISLHHSYTVSNVFQLKDNLSEIAL